MKLSTDEAKEIMAQLPNLSGEMIPPEGKEVNLSGATYYIYMDPEGQVLVYSDEPRSAAQDYLDSGMPGIRTLLLVVAGIWALYKATR